ncbi:MAG: EAL domain-containing protein [Rhizobiaceae bacterium]|nr:EAL domain-containing protein [Rhizobiaceae bacterium]
MDTATPPDQNDKTSPARGPGGSRRLVTLFRFAYWGALVIMAGMAMASFLMQQRMLDSHRRDVELQTLASTQKALSQRVVFLANAAEEAAPDLKAPLLQSLRLANAEFEKNYDRFLEETAADPYSAGRADPGSIDGILFGRPYHLDHFSNGLAANGWRLVAALEASLNPGNADAIYPAGTDRARLDDTVASATMAGYTALEKAISDRAAVRLDTLLTLHRRLFFATIGVIVLIALVIFRPMAQVIRHRTQELVAARNSMAYVAIHDGLTGLHNRTFLTNHFETLLKGSHRRHERLAVLQLDLDRFKQINDTLGHAAGDLVLVETAERMRCACRASDLCVRLGGDEFVMILNAAGSSEDIQTLARRILDKINEPISYGGATILPGASAGIAVYPVDADNAADLLVHADLALYSAKKQGGGSFTFFSDELRAELEHRKQLERDLKLAIRDRSFSVYFQPQVSLRDGRVTGVEALVRWIHPERGVVSPGEFIPIAEKSGLMVPIGRIIMEKAIERAAEWEAAGIDFGRLAINVSGIELREGDFVTFLFDTLRKTGLPTERLSLEIVESVILDDEKTGIAAKLRTIRAAGVHLELDDFGTGYASLSHVNPNEIDRLKIDRRFVHNINANGDNSKIVRAITELARGLGISIIAEGAETEDELTSLLDIGCEQVQGYSIAFPMPEDEARDWLAQRTPKGRVLELKRDVVA